MPEPSTRPALAWLDVLDRIEQSLAQSLRLAPLPAERPRAHPPGTAEPLRKLDERLARWQAHLDQAESNARTAEEHLVEDEAILTHWLERAGKARERLEEWARNGAR